MTLQEFIEKTKTDAALNAKVNAAIMEKVIMPMAQAEGVELSDEELTGVSGGFFISDSWAKHQALTDSYEKKIY